MQRLSSHQLQAVRHKLSGMAVRNGSDDDTIRRWMSVRYPTM